MKWPNSKYVRARRAFASRRSMNAFAIARRTSRMQSRFSRRRFLHRTAKAGLLLSLSPGISKPEAEEAERRAIFFNLSSSQVLPGEDAKARKQHFLVIGGRRHRLHPISQNPQLLTRARQRNAFLSAVPDDQITHYIESFDGPDDITPLAYIYSVIDEEAGTWSMDSVLQYLSPSDAPQAYAHARELTPAGPLPLSAKREFYGIAAAFAEQDVADEFALFDYTDTARTLIALHPDLLCANPAGAETIAVSYINANTGTTFLARLLQSQGPAMPQQAPGQLNANGWATLRPINQSDGTPFKMENGLNQYFPDWSPGVDAQVAKLVAAFIPKVKNDPALGADVTNLSASSATTLTDSIRRQLTGKIWYRRDGVTAVDHGSPAFLDAGVPKWDFHQKNGETGLHVTQPTVNISPDGKVQITFDENIQNWFLRYLGAYVQFRDRYDNVIPKSTLPSDTLPDRTSDFGLDRGDSLYAGIVSPAFSIAGIPVAPGTLSFPVNVPDQAATLNLFYSGLGLSGSQIGPDRITDVGMGFTIALNFGMVALFMAVGVSTISETLQEIAGYAGEIAGQLLTVLGSVLNSSEPNLTDAGLTFLEGLLNGFAQTGLEILLKIIVVRLGAAQLINSIPVAGQIARAAAAVIGAVTLAVSLIEVGISPPTYQFDVSFTHDLGLDILPDPNRGSFPQVPAGYVLYYKVNYLFENGSPHYLDHVDVPDPFVSSVPIRLEGIPWGGQVNVSVGFYVRKESTEPSENDWCASRGTTGLVSNKEDTAPDIVVEDILVPIQRQTVYIHTSKITLDAAGKHRWVKTTTPPPYIPPSSGQQPGDIGELRSITVRQATSKNPGYVGYSWQSYSTGVIACEPEALGQQLDQAANLNTNQGNDGANAENGYTVTACGLPGGALGGLKISYNPLIDPTANFYLDTSSLMLREVQLDPVPDFTDPKAGKSFGKLNLGSTMLVLHPSGHIVSVNNANSKLEALRLPSDAMDDTDAAKRYLARTYSGQGSRPGLMRSPLAAAITAEGAIVVLEDSTTNNRIQAFDLGGNPLRYFTGQPDPYFLYLSATEGSTYLDIAVEFTGYLYVLSRSGSPPVFRLDIYHPAQSDTKPICTTRGMNAARLTVDFWRNVYTLNYEVLKLPSGAIPGRTEPSVSFWVPPPPTI